MKFLSWFARAFGHGPEGESREDRMARMRAPYLDDLERRFGSEFVARVRSVCTYPVSVGGRIRFCGRPGTHDGIIGVLCDEHYEHVHGLPLRTIRA